MPFTARRSARPKDFNRLLTHPAPATLLLLATTLSLPQSLMAGHGVNAGMVKVVQTSQENTNNNASVSAGLVIGSFAVTGGNRGDYDVKIGHGVSASYDEARGVLLSSVTENGRDNFGTNGYPASAIERNGSGTYRIISQIAPGSEYNVNVAGAWFPYDRYIGGLACNSEDLTGGPNNALTGSPQLVLGTHFRDFGSGKSMVNLRGLGIDSRTSGVLLVNHASDEDNFALAQVNPTNGAWNVFVRDIGQLTYSSYEQDPVAFVFIPRTNTNLISGRFNGDASISMFSGETPQFTVTNLGDGRWDFRIPGHSPTNGILIISPEGGGNYNGDNIVSYEAYADGTGWEIQSRDTPANGLQTPVGVNGEPEAVCSFVYVPIPPPGIEVSGTNDLTTTGTGETAEFQIALESRPASLVTISLSSSAPGKGAASPGTLVFGPSDWDVPQTVTVTGKPGASYGYYQITINPATSSDKSYQGINPNDVRVLSLPARATLAAPATNATVGTAPWLQVRATNVLEGNLTVRFFGRPAPTLFPGPDFTMVVLPDTQMYTGGLGGGKKEMFIAQTEWAITNRLLRNIPYVTQLGDISNNGDNPEYFFQWQNATNAMYRLENPTRTKLQYGMPYGVAVGNHEISPIGNAAIGTTSNYNRYFGVSHFAGRNYYAGHYGTNNNNHYDFFSASGMDFVVLYFEYNTNPPPQVLAWGNDILRTNAHRRAIVVTHNMGNTATPVVWSAQARAIYGALKGNTNLFMMLGGHVSGQGRRDDVYQGRTIRTFVQDYQGWDLGGNGFMRLFEFSPSNNVVVAQTYSPVTREYLTDEDSEFYFPYDMQPVGPGASAPFAALATNSAVVQGELTAWRWTNLQPNQGYEWYVTVTDEAGTTVTSPVWCFRTALTNQSPTIVNLAQTIIGDSPASVQLSATDPDGDALTFTNHTAPLYGLLKSFDPATGILTYWPPRGFRGADRFIFSANDGQRNSSMATMNLHVIAPADQDSDGLPDEWETAYGVSSPDTDSDSDGQSNLAEYRANTNPTNASSSLRISSAIRSSDGSVALTWSGVGGVRYRVLYSDDLPGFPGLFTELARDAATEWADADYGTETKQTFIDPTAATNTTGRFYQIRITP